MSEWTVATYSANEVGVWLATYFSTLDWEQIV